MRKISRVATQILGATGMFIGFLVTGYSWAATVAPLPPIFKNPWHGIGFGILIFFVSALWFMWKYLERFTWVEPVIILTPTLLNRTSPFNEPTVFALLTVHNDEETQITDCYATLEEATNLYGGDLIPVPLGKKERLKWAEAKYGTDDCKIIIEAKSDKNVHVANTSFNFAFCKDSAIPDSMLAGLYNIRIRIDGKWNGRDMQPQFFDGHLLMDRTMTDSGIVTRTAFDVGDWTQNKDIPEWYKERKRSA